MPKYFWFFLLWSSMINFTLFVCHFFSQQAIQLNLLTHQGVMLSKYSSEHFWDQWGVPGGAHFFSKENARDYNELHCTSRSTLCVVGNEISNPSLKPEQCCIHFTLD